MPGLRDPLDVLSRRLPASAAVAAGLAALVLYAVVAVARADALLPRAYDQAFFEQVVWNLGHGRGFQSGFFGADFLGLHLSPLLVLPAALERVWPDARVLSLLQALALAATAPAGFLLLRSLLPATRAGAWMAGAVAAPLPVWAEMQRAAVADFHPEALAVPLLMVAAWAGLRRRPVLMVGLALAAMAAKEDQAYGAVLVGLLAATQDGTRRAGLALALAAALWAPVAVGIVMPALRGGVPSQLSDYYSGLAGAGAGGVLAALVRPPGWLAFAGMVASAAGLPLLCPRWLLAAAPPLLFDLLSSHDPQPRLGLQYGLPLVFPLVVAAGLGGRRLLTWTARLPAPALAAPALLVAISLGPGLLPTAPAGALGRLLSCTAGVPAAAPVAADDDVSAPLAGRPRLAPITDARASDWVVRDRLGVRPSYVDASRREAVIDGLAGAARSPACDDGRFQVWAPAGA